MKTSIFFILSFFIFFTLVLFFIAFFLSKPVETSTSLKDSLDKITKKIEKIEKIGKRLTRKKSRIPVYYINMDKHVDRNQFMLEQLQKYFIKYNRITGFNGYLIENTENDTVNGITFFNKYALSKGEIGCLLSHLIAIKTSYENNDSLCLIIEDDTMVHLLSLDISLEKIIDEAPSDWEIIQLFCIKNTKEELGNLPLSLHTEKYSYYKHQPTHYSFSTVAYIINRKGMKKILKQTYIHKDTFYLGPTNQNIPKYGAADFFLYDLTVTYILYPNIFYANNINLKSTIENHDSHTDTHVKSAKNVIDYYNNIL